jgi:hypothetical protein
MAESYTYSLVREELEHLRAIGHAASTSVPNLGCVDLWALPSGLVAAATDSYMLVFRRITKNGPERPLRVRVEAKALMGALKEAIPNKKAAVLTTRHLSLDPDAGVTVATASGSITVMPNGERFPDWWKLLPKSNGAGNSHTAINPDLVGRLGKALNCNPSLPRYLTLDIPAEPLKPLIATVTPREDAYALLMPVREH